MNQELSGQKFGQFFVYGVKEMILLIDVCVRGEHSRTRELAECYLKDKKFTRLALAEEDIQPLDKSRLEKRQKLIEKGDFSDEMFRYAKQFAQADEIVIAAPYWDLSFPALLKIYIENICVVGVTFDYLSDSTSKSRCKAKKLTYITTSGGVIPERNFGYDYIRAVAEEFFKIEKFEYIKAEKFDIYGEDHKAIMENAKNKIFFGK